MPPAEKRRRFTPPWSVEKTDCPVSWWETTPARRLPTFTLKLNPDADQRQNSTAAHRQRLTWVVWKRCWMSSSNWCQWCSQRRWSRPKCPQRSGRTQWPWHPFGPSRTEWEVETSSLLGFSPRFENTLAVLQSRKAKRKNCRGILARLYIHFKVSHETRLIAANIDKLPGTAENEKAPPLKRARQCPALALVHSRLKFAPAGFAKGGSSMASIIPFIRRSSDFDDASTTVLGEAFDAACRDLPEKDDLLREIIARRIIESAQKGERDPDRLRAIALSGLRTDASPPGKLIGHNGNWPSVRGPEKQSRPARGVTTAPNGSTALCPSVERRNRATRRGVLLLFDPGEVRRASWA